MIRLKKNQVAVSLYIVTIKEDGYHVFLEGKLDGKDALLLLDTGASRTVFDYNTIREIYREMEMEQNEDKAVGVGAQQVDNFIAEIPLLELGELKIPTMQVGIIDLSHVIESYKKINLPAITGILGSDVLVHHNAIIYFKEKKLVLDIC